VHSELSPRQLMAQAKHQQGLELLEKQQLAGALRLLGESLAQEETCERRNDWGIAQFTAGQLIEAEHAFRYALELEPENREVSGNLGVLLVECQRENEAFPFLPSALAGGGAGSGTSDVLLTVCRDTVAAWLAEFKKQLQDFLISIDGDNFAPAEEDFFTQHAIVCHDMHIGSTVEASAGWFNVCTQLNLESDRVTFPRGFPYFARHQKQETHQRAHPTTIRINAGLWIEEPDLDAMTWLTTPVRATSFRGESMVVGPRTWSPVNTQNTALHREVIPSYDFVRMGSPLSGMHIDRYGHAFSGYFSPACARSLGHAVRVGTPTATHARNSHNYLRDATQELACVCILEDLLPWLQEAP
jgi:Reversibly glycosylated polypeptide